VIALYDPVTPMIQIGLALLGLIILVSLAFGWRVARSDNEELPKDLGDDLHDVTDRIRSKRDQGE
jgi:hypothetical protein